ncbi:Bardet-Biedl syndrome 5 protein [Trypanosoma melophagium]|uniref:Bardet-Biedl syndrome 5 protein n=1 Tax=Trypanosoma melophagium TaxID=715481 RepID=UPI00351A1506|nr:Bardet-Biedl syndrome 5 protein [Trypanosoma melophagium]
MPSSSASTENASVMKSFTFWYDREVRFDISTTNFEVQTTRGELLLATIRPVEDTKGNNGEEGIFFVTNLRCLWHSCINVRKNLSIGYYGIQNMEMKQATSRLRGSTEALYITARFAGSRFEFVFTYLLQDSRLCSTVMSVWRAYESSRLYRELRLRSSIIRNGELILLPDEKLFSCQRGVSNVSNEQGHMGTFFTTNVRIVWCAQPASNFNVSIPYLQVIGLHIRQTRFGQALVIETSMSAGNYVLGFRIDPRERLVEIFKESVSLWKAWTARPVLGVAVVVQDTPSDANNSNNNTNSNNSNNNNNNNNNKNNKNNNNNNTGGSKARGTTTVNEKSSLSEVMAPQPRVQDGENVVKEVPTDAFAAYYADIGQKGVDRRPEYDVSIGLAVEKLRNGVTLQDLWTVLT